MMEFGLVFYRMDGSGLRLCDLRNRDRELAMILISERPGGNWWRDAIALTDRRVVTI